MPLKKSATSIKDRSHDEAMSTVFSKNPSYAVELLNSILEEGDPAELLIALRQMAAAFGGVPTIAGKASLNRTQLYRTLSEEGNPAIHTLSAILKVMGLRLAVQPLKGKRAKAA